MRPIAFVNWKRSRSVVASISARGGVQAALGYYSHLGRDDYYTRSGEPPGGWAGEGAALSVPYGSCHQV